MPTDFAMAQRTQEYLRSQNPHGRERDDTYTHISDLASDCLYATLLGRQGSLPKAFDEWTHGVFNWGAFLENPHVKILLHSNPGWSVAHLGRKGLALDNGLGRLSPTFRLDKRRELGGSIDAILVVPHVGRLLVELKTVAWKTPTGNNPGEWLWENMQAGNDLAHILLDPHILQAYKWLRKWAWQTVGYMGLWNASTALLSILIKDNGWIVPIWFNTNDSDVKDSVDQRMKYAELIRDTLHGKGSEIMKTNSWNTCGKCQYLPVCQPDIIKRDVTKIVTDEGFIELYERSKVLAEATREFRDVQARLRNYYRQELPEDRPDNELAIRLGKRLIKIKRTVVPEQTVDDLLAKGKTVVKKGYTKYEADELPAEEKENEDE